VSNDRATSTPFTKGLGFFVVLGISLLIILGIFVSPADVNQGESVRIMYAHVPGAWLAYLAFVMTAVSSAAYLWKRTRSLTWDRIAGASAEVGVLFMGISLVTGSLWGRLTWGTYWTWDARLTTTAFLFVTYIGYLAVRGLGGTHQQRARRSAVLALLAVLEIPLVHFSVELWNTLHQKASVAGRGTDVEMNGLMLFTLFLGVVVFTLMYIWLVLHRQRSLMLEDMLEDSGLDNALSERRAEATRAGH